jgi:predicted nucleic acid-binding protein
VGYSAILIDTSVIIDFLRKKNKRRTLLWKIKENYECFISSITIFELYCGAKNETHFNDLKKMMPWFNVIDFDNETAKYAAEIYSTLKKDNCIVEFRDIFIAASAIKNNLSLTTLNKKHFERINKLTLQHFEV